MRMITRPEKCGDSINVGISVLTETGYCSCGVGPTVIPILRGCVGCSGDIIGLITFYPFLVFGFVKPRGVWFHSSYLTFCGDVCR